MKKRNIIICNISILLVIGFISILVFGSNRNTFTENGVTYALTVDGVKQNSFPSKGMYRVDTECTNATCKWDYDAWKLYIEDLTGDVSCDITFTTITKNNFNDYIINLLTTAPEQGLGSLIHEIFTNSSGTLVDTGYRYEGKNPNNYVWFNNELWRIIGVMNEESHGQKGLNLVKLIRNETIGGFAYNKDLNNDWSISSLKAILNNDYLKKQDGNNQSYCYKTNNLKGNCDFSAYGINLANRKMIKEVTWYLGGMSNNSSDENYYRSPSDKFYEYERKNIVYGSNKVSDVGYVGLMYISDYGFSALESQCSRKTSLDNYYCSTNSWLFGSGLERTMTPYSSSKWTFRIGFSGNVDASSVESSFIIRPVVYLNENVYVLDGDGSITDPYIIGMDEA